MAITAVFCSWFSAVALQVGIINEGSVLGALLLSTVGEHGSNRGGRGVELSAVGVSDEG